MTKYRVTSYYADGSIDISTEVETWHEANRRLHNWFCRIEPGMKITVESLIHSERSDD